MRITLEREDQVIEIEIHDDSDAYEIANAFKTLMVFLTFNESTVRKILRTSEDESFLYDPEINPRVA